MSSRHVWTEKERKWTVKNYPLIGTLGCSEKLGISRSRVLSFACRNGIKTMPSVKANAAKAFHEANRKARDAAAMEFSISLPEQAYTLGFLWGDGYLHKKDPKNGTYYARIELTQEDYITVVERWTSAPSNRCDACSDRKTE